MNTELNEPKEMLRRLVYVVYAGAAIATLWLVVSLVIDWTPVRFVAAIGCACGSAAVHYLGNHYFGFEGIRETMVFANMPPRLAPHLRPVYQRTQELVAAMQNEKLKPMERQLLRNELNDIVRKEPKIFALLEQEIIAVHPTIRRPSNS